MRGTIFGVMFLVACLSAGGSAAQAEPLPDGNYVCTIGAAVLGEIRIAGTL